MPKKWGRYSKNYNPEWEKLPLFKPWLTMSSEADVLNGKGEAYCKLCKTNLRAQMNDFKKHTLRDKHQTKLKSLDRVTQRAVDDTSAGGVYVVNDDLKIADLRLALFIASHTAVKSIDHLGELLKQLVGKESPLAKLRIHRTKCSKLISAVNAPALLTELVTDVGDWPYCIIADEATDCSTSKFMGLCIRYYSRKKKQMITDFLGLVQVTGTKGLELANSLKEYLGVIGLKLQNLDAVGTDGAPNMCGSQNSFYSHLRRDVPTLQVIKCTCHSIDKCAEYAHKVIPDIVTKIMKETHNYFAHSTLRQSKYAEYYKTLNGGKAPLKIAKMVETRWLSWLPVVESIVSNWTELKGFFVMLAASPEEKTDKASDIAALYSDPSVYLFLLFLRNILREINQLNMAFQLTNADVTKLHCDLRNLIFSLAARIVKEHAIPHVGRAGVFRAVEVQALRQALSNSANLLPLDKALFGESFKVAAVNSKITEDQLRAVRNTCGQYIFTLCLQLFDRLPGNIEAVERLRHFRPNVALSKSVKPHFNQLPLDLVRPGEDHGKLEGQWILMGNTPLFDLCPHADQHDDLGKMDIIHFWSCVLECSNAAGEHVFEELALFVLKCLTIPVSNAVVERVFSFLNAIKNKHRNKMQLVMLESVIRIRVHFKVIGECCNTFHPTKAMIERFTSRMYLDFQQEHDQGQFQREGRDEHELDDEDYHVLTMFSADGEQQHCTLLPV